ncbi:MAG: hypothetical protein KAI47_26330, partial [Deltaproteobacteria bacterium]|nr:hypothetical protein [Deltaproteobacteria bacterium]
MSDNHTPKEDNAGEGSSVEATERTVEATGGDLPEEQRSTWLDSLISKIDQDMIGEDDASEMSSGEDDGASPSSEDGGEGAVEGPLRLSHRSAPTRGGAAAEAFKAEDVPEVED